MFKMTFLPVWQQTPKAKRNVAWALRFVWNSSVTFWFLPFGLYDTNTRCSCLMAATTTMMMMIQANCRKWAGTIRPYLTAIWHAITCTLLQRHRKNGVCYSRPVPATPSIAISPLSSLARFKNKILNDNYFENWKERNREKHNMCVS